MRKVDKFTWEQNLHCVTLIQWNGQEIWLSSGKGQRIKAMRCEILKEMTDNKESVNLKLAFLKKRTSRAEATVILKRKLQRGRKTSVCVERKWLPHTWQNIIFSKLSL